jgi:hypothetical protein
MRKTILTVVAGLSVAFTTMAMADTAMNSVTPLPEQMAQPISAAADDARQIVCHHLVHEGTLMPHAVCLTKRTWERVREETQMAVSNWESGRH